MITRIGHMAVRAKDIEETARFYRETLGLEEAFRMHNGPGGSLGSVHIYVAPSQYIEIFPDGARETPGGEDLVGLHHLCFEVEDIQAALAELQRRGAPIDTPLKKGVSGCMQFWTHDPDGTRIELMELPGDCLQIQANRRISGEVAE